MAMGSGGPAAGQEKSLPEQRGRDYRVGGREQLEYAGFLIPWWRVISRFAQLRPIRRLPKTTAIAANSTAIGLAIHGEHA
jgi:hypothetical protein